MDTLGQWVYDLAEAALSILPDSPFMFLQTLSNSPIAQWLGVLNWFIPISTFVVILEAWCSAILLYYVAAFALRWAKAIS